MELYVPYNARTQNPPRAATQQYKWTVNTKIIMYLSDFETKRPRMLETRKRRFESTHVAKILALPLDSSRENQLDSMGEQKEERKNWKRQQSMPANLYASSSNMRACARKRANERPYDSLSWDIAHRDQQHTIYYYFRWLHVECGCVCMCVREQEKEKRSSCNFLSNSVIESINFFLCFLLRNKSHTHTDTD